MAKKVLFILGTRWASAYYRMGQAANFLKKNGFTAVTIMFDTVDPIHLTAFEPQIMGKPKEIDLRKFDTVIFQLVWHDALIHVIEMLKSAGVKTVMELDDNYFALPRDNPSWISFHPKILTRKHTDGNYWGTKYDFRVNKKLDILKKSLSMVDLIQVSTLELAEAYKHYGEIVVLENCIDNKIYDAVYPRENKKPVMGWFGTRTHTADMMVTAGCYPPQEDFRLYITAWDEIREAMFKNFTNIEVIPPFELEDLPSIVKRCDFGIVPLVDNTFNAGKSDLKGLEFGAASMPVIASDVPPYQRWIKHGVNGFLVKKNKPKFWIRYMNQLVQDRELCKQLGKEAKKDALKRDIRTNIDKWVKAHFI